MTAPTFPEFGDVAAHLAALADLLPGDDNRHRQALRDVVTALRAPHRDLDDATRHTMMALFDLSGGGKLVDKPETWLLSAVALFVQHEKSRLADLDATASASALVAPRAQSVAR